MGSSTATRLAQSGPRMQSERLGQPGAESWATDPCRNGCSFCGGAPASSVLVPL